MSSMKGRRKSCIPSGDSCTLKESRTSSWGRRATSRASEFLLERKLCAREGRRKDVRAEGTPAACRSACSRAGCAPGRRGRGGVDS